MHMNKNKIKTFILYEEKQLNVRIQGYIKQKD